MISNYSAILKLSQRTLRPSLLRPTSLALRYQTASATVNVAHNSLGPNAPQVSPHPKLSQDSKAAASQVVDVAHNSMAPGAKQVSPHPKLTQDANVTRQWSEDSDVAALKDYMLRHPVYTPEQLNSVTVTKRPKEGLSDWIAFAALKTLRAGFDTATNYSDKHGVMTERQWLNRICFLETLAGVPGIVAGMVRHMRSLRLLRRDNGWVHTLLEEAENERMHLLTFMKLKQPSPFFRFCVLFAQGAMFNVFFVSYIISPKTCHRFVGYLEEEAVHTYGNCLKDIEVGNIQHWATTPAPKIAIQYWRLKEDATVLDVVRAVRADEAEHRDVNHTLAGLKPDEPNPF